jgi:hypothetical protein
MLVFDSLSVPSLAVFFPLFLKQVSDILWHFHPLLLNIFLFSFKNILSFATIFCLSSSSLAAHCFWQEFSDFPHNLPLIVVGSSSVASKFAYFSPFPSFSHFMTLSWLYFVEFTTASVRVRVSDKVVLWIFQKRFFHRLI